MLDQINIIQLNVNHCAAAQTLLAQTARERNADVVLLSEPYLPEVGSSGMLFDELGKVSIKCRTSLAMEEREIEPMRGFAYAKIKENSYSSTAPMIHLATARSNSRTRSPQRNRFLSRATKMVAAHSGLANKTLSTFRTPFAIKNLNSLIEPKTPTNNLLSPVTKKSDLCCG